jgi:NarL family two-component system response regulator LiaR
MLEQGTNCHSLKFQIENRSSTERSRDMVAPAPEKRIGIVVIDDHPVALAGIRVGLKKFDDIHLNAEAIDGASGLRRIEEHQPDVAVIDVLLPDMDGLEVTARAAEISPDTRVIITSGDLSIATMSRAAHLGVAGYFHKSGAIERLVLLIRAAYRGEPDEFESLAVPPTAGGLDELTLREHQLLMLLANGSSLKQAAMRMELSYPSADRLKQALMAKLKVHDLVELVRYAIHEQLVQDYAQDFCRMAARAGDE